MQRTTALVLTFVLAVPALALAKTKEGVTMPDEIDYAGKKLVLNGQGVREATIFNVSVYVGGLYLEKKSTDGNAIINSEETKRIVMSFVRDVNQDDILDAYKGSFEKNGGDKVQAKVDQFLKLMTGVKKGDTLAVSYVPEKGVVVEVKGQEKGVVPGADFAKVVFSIWLGANPPNKSLKAGLLGG